jgi:hypothetical protein
MMPYESYGGFGGPVSGFWNERSSAPISSGGGPPSLAMLGPGGYDQGSGGAGGLADIGGGGASAPWMGGMRRSGGYSPWGGYGQGSGYGGGMPPPWMRGAWGGGAWRNPWFDAGPQQQPQTGSFNTLTPQTGTAPPPQAPNPVSTTGMGMNERTGAPMTAGDAGPPQLGGGYSWPMKRLAAPSLAF